ncbi:MAG: hypothetical protein EXR79_12015 [Myxococcales bacterium]|nr:hypothetical protein [Myxococcales bacterium]
MPRTLTDTDLTTALAARYDHASARIVLAEAVAACELPAAAARSPADVSRLAWWLQQQGDRAQPAASALLEVAASAAGEEPSAFSDGEDGEADDPDCQRLEPAEAAAFFRSVAEAAVATALREPGRVRPRQSASFVKCIIAD